MPASGNWKRKVEFTRQFFPVPRFPPLSLFNLILLCKYKSNACFQCRIFLKRMCTKQANVEDVHLLQITCIYFFLSCACHSLLILWRATCPFSVAFQCLANGCYCLLMLFPCPVFSFTSLPFLSSLWTCTFSLLFQISTPCSPSSPSSLPFLWNTFRPPLLFLSPAPLCPGMSSAGAL